MVGNYFSFVCLKRLHYTYILKDIFTEYSYIFWVDRFFFFLRLIIHSKISCRHIKSINALAFDMNPIVDAMQVLLVDWVEWEALECTSSNTAIFVYAKHCAKFFMSVTSLHNINKAIFFFTFYNKESWKLETLATEWYKTVLKTA